MLPIILNTTLPVTLPVTYREVILRAVPSCIQCFEYDVVYNVLPISLIACFMLTEL